jgi:hypothetical protein
VEGIGGRAKALGQFTRTWPGFPTSSLLPRHQASTSRCQGPFLLDSMFSSR